MIAVGFADMVGFTLLSQHLSDEELAAVVRRFEEISHDIVTGAGGRVVKMIGDEVMFVVDSVAAAARIGLEPGRCLRGRRPLSMCGSAWPVGPCSYETATTSVRREPGSPHRDSATPAPS